MSHRPGKTKASPEHVAGSVPAAREKQKSRICLGRIGGPHGLHGEVRLHSFTAEPEAIARYGPLETEDGGVVAIESLRPAKNHFVARLAGIRDRDAAEQVANARLYVARDQLPEIDEAAEFYHADLIGLAVVDRAGRRLGTVVGIHNFGAGDLIEVRAEGEKQTAKQTAMLPFDAATVPLVDIAAGRIVVEPLAGGLSLPLREGEEGEAEPSGVKAETATAPPLTRTTAGWRRQRSTLSRKGRGPKRDAR